MEKMRILLVEDDIRQIKWAKECFELHELTICESQEDFLAIDLKSFDFIFTDLFLPKAKGEKPDYKIGFNIFNQLVELTTNNQLKACALISNFEHHCDELDRNAKSDLADLFERTNYGVNVFVQFDTNWSRYTHFMSPEMRITTKEEIREMGKNGTLQCDGIPPEVVAVREYGYTFLKRYPEILEKIGG